ncbi:MAG: RsmE family RNA methyltransferase [Candidatus Sulfotelmatobacter sp.]
MTRRRWIADEVSGNRAILIGEHAGHLVRVLRARVGQEFDVATPKGARRGRISSLTPDRVEFELGEEISSRASVGITLALAVFKFDCMEWAIEKCTELGVSRIVPLIARRTDSHLASASTKRVGRWQRIARQASQQSRRDEPSQIANPVKLSEILNSEATLRIVLDETEQRAMLLDVLKNDVLKNDAPPREANSSSAETDVILAIGPEGGWTEDELQFFHQAAWISASLGETILRTETAAIAATAIVASTLRES